MEARALSLPTALARWETYAAAILILVLLGLALANKDRRQRTAYDEFLKRAARIEEGLLRFAAEHDGRFPSDTMFTSAPRGAGTHFYWDPTWNLDYEAHPNGRGGHYVCLEFCGPTGERVYQGLCSRAELRASHGRGQPVPGSQNRLWVIQEDARVLPPSARDGG